MHLSANEPAQKLCFQTPVLLVNSGLRRVPSSHFRSMRLAAYKVIWWRCRFCVQFQKYDA